MRQLGLRRAMAAMVIATGITALAVVATGCSPVRVRTDCLYLHIPTPAEQEGAAREMEAHPELPYVRIQAHGLDYAIRQNQACWGKVLKQEGGPM